MASNCVASYQEKHDNLFKKVKPKRNYFAKKKQVLMIIGDYKLDEWNKQRKKTTKMLRYLLNPGHDSSAKLYILPAQ